MIKPLVMFFAVMTSQNLVASEIYEDAEARMKVKFPTDFEVEREVAEDGLISISLSCSYGDMILVSTVFISTEAVTEDENLGAELLEVARICGTVGSKLNTKTIYNWNVDDDSGLSSSLKCKGEYKGLIGSYYVIIQGAYEWQFLILGGKKTYDYNVESRFINSFEILGE